MRHSDNLDGTFSNPVIFADYPDPDIIRVGADFYMVSSSFTTVPGVPICHSRDLVNWSLIGHAYDRLPGSNPAYSLLDGKAAYRGGSWAPFIRHHRGRFYIGFNTPAEGFFMTIAEQIGGPFELIPFGAEFYDPSLLFTSDGRVLLAHGANGICITELSADARSVLSPPRFVFQTPVGTPLEGSHFYERAGWFYLCLTSRGYNGLQLVARARDPFGPYAWRVVLADDMNYAGAGLHQGGFVELADGESWFFLFQDRDAIGRVPVLIPMKWEEGWPVLGDPDNFGKAPVTLRKPALPASPRSPLHDSDDFESPRLGLAWQWNHNPDDALWSLAARPGWLRLLPSVADDLRTARNTLTQKVPGPSSRAETRLDVRGLAARELAGMAIVNLPFALIGAVWDRERRLFIVRQDDGNEIARESVTPPEDGMVYFRVEAMRDGRALFSYRLTERDEWRSLGEPFRMQFTVKTFLGNRYALFAYAEAPSIGDSGQADFDYFHITSPGVDNRHAAAVGVSFCDYDAERGTDTQRLVDKQPAQFLIDLNDGDWVRFNRLDFGEATSAGQAELIVRAAPVGDGGKIEVRDATPDGELLATLDIPGSGCREWWASVFGEFRCFFPGLHGVRTICFCFTGPAGRPLFRLDWFQVVR